MQTAIAPDYPASRLFGGSVDTPEREQQRGAPANGRTAESGRAPVFDLGVGIPVPVLGKPMKPRTLEALRSVEEIAHRMANEAALIERLIADNDLPLVPRGIGTARYACGDLLHNVEEAIRAHQTAMERA